MEIRNAIIIITDDTTLRMSLEEKANFTGNVVFARDRLPPSLASELDRAINRIDEDHIISR